MPLFDKILIANRGEIACRVMRTAKRMGIKTVAVYSDVDSHAQHVKMADEAIHIGASPAAESYLIEERILDAMKTTGAQAVHPGYGFLSENAEFSEAVEGMGASFIGPGAEAIRLMGIKDVSMDIAQDAGVSTAPRYTKGDVTTPEHAMEVARGLGFPVIMKAVKGGGGKGMRVAWTEDELIDGFNSARSEAMNAFGDDKILFQQFVCPHDGRHIEVQILGDKHGNYLAFPERECSIQRRNQKVIEEAPSPFCDAEMRKAMGDQAVALAAAVGYSSAGTVEFLVDPKTREWYFLEMNTRLQVEHPITEYITGVDLVEQMIRIAAGEELAIKQDDLQIRGHSFEARVYAEDPQNNFRPGTGALSFLRTPTPGPDVRVDTGVVEGDSVSVFYDPMIAKLAVWGPDRPAALAKLKHSLMDYNIAGLRTNIKFCHDIAEHPEFVAGDATTTFIEENEEALFAVTPPPAAKLAQAALAVILDEQGASAAAQAGTAEPASPWREAGGFRVNTATTRTFAFRNTDDESELEVSATYLGAGAGYAISVGEATMQMTGAFDGDGRLRCTIDGHSYNSRVAVLGGSVHVFGQDGAVHLDFVDPEFLTMTDEAAASNSVLAPMDGTIMEVLVKPGDVVEENQPVVVLYAMKMESVLRAPRAGTVASVSAQVATQASIGATLVTLEEEPDEDADADAE